jgi:glycosyltransferase involved in cell wall biosynthesis
VKETWCVSAEKPRISAFVITKNNGDKIAGCLESLGWADEVIVVDDFSSDETPDICRRFPNVRFSQNTFRGFQEQKIHAMAQTANDWVLKVDADEQITPEMRDSIGALTGDDLREYACFEFKRLTCFWGKWIRHGSFYPDYNPRLFNKHAGAWGGINPHDKFMTRGRTKKLAGDILHFQNWDLYTYACRTALYADISAAEYYKGGRRAHWHQVTLRPLYTFLYRYFFRLGILDGWHGFVISVMGGYGTFLKYMKIFELQHGKVPKRMELP